MDVIHDGIAGLDVHKETIVAKKQATGGPFPKAETIGHMIETILKDNDNARVQSHRSTARRN
jgi:hypothetical protein